jgi:hypothetical protein
VLNMRPLRLHSLLGPVPPVEIVMVQGVAGLLPSGLSSRRTRPLQRRRKARRRPGCRIGG